MNKIFGQLKKLLKKSFVIAFLVVAVFYLFFKFGVRMGYIVKNNTRIEKIGHRGACGYEPENTIQSFKKAIKLGVDAIELDVRTCKTGELVVIHDAKVDRTTSGCGFVKDLTVDQIDSLYNDNTYIGDVKKVVTLEKALDVIDRKAKVMIEVKDRGMVKPLSKILSRYIKKKDWKVSDFCVISFNYKEVLDFAKLNPKISVGLSFSKIPKDKSKFYRKIEKFSNVDCMVIDYKNIDSQFVSELHKKNMKVFVYTVNKKSDIIKIKKLFVDGIISDYPDII